MARTNAALVEAIIDVESGIDLTPFIDAANSMVTYLCTGDQVDSEYPESQLIMIETWLAAHFYCMYDPRASEEKAGDVRARYETKIERGLDLSKYGQMAMQLDYQGSLSANNEAIKNGNAGNTVGVTWLGTPPEDID
ncbi:unnamed protein product [marine sediment metagenome]|uniref:Uncharacterized protein n=1 Tax=marine sediment metagenome TaxID=412755 RepID=X0WQK9_9ZZZZ